jgi:hypothetical protein
MASLYPVQEELLSPKCQCVTFEKSGRVLGSCDSLFAVSGMSNDQANIHFPFLKAVADELSKATAGEEPVFYPGLDFSFGAYRSICDFTFMKTTDARGKDHFVWMIYDNSTHYRVLIQEKQNSRRASEGSRNQKSITATFRKAG